jgi:hypothetical protein
VLEAEKLVAAAWLTAHWNSAPSLLRLVLEPAFCCRTLESVSRPFINKIDPRSCTVARNEVAATRGFNRWGRLRLVVARQVGHVQGYGAHIKRGLMQNMMRPALGRSTPLIMRG